MKKNADFEFEMKQQISLTIDTNIQFYMIFYKENIQRVLI